MEIDKKCASPMRPRVGNIMFLNCLPIYWGLTQSGAWFDINLIADTPEHLSDALICGDLDVSPISLAEYLRHSEELLLLPNIAIGSNGPALSCNLFSQVPIEELNHKEILITAKSRTTVLLFQLILENRYGIHPNYRISEFPLEEMMRRGGGAIMIGDTALQARFSDSPRSSGLYVYDVGEMWKEWTELPVVFAVWAARRDFANLNPDLVKEIHTLLINSRDWGMSQVDEIAKRAARWEVFDADTLSTYFRTLDYHLDESQLAGIMEFAQRAAKYGALPPLENIYVFGPDLGNIIVMETKSPRQL